MKKWSADWISSTRPGKQRKYVHEAPNHRRKSFIVAPLERELSQETGIKRLTIITGDLVVVMKGEHRRKTGTVSEVDRSKRRIFVDGLTRKKIDGREMRIPFFASNLALRRLNLKDRRRLKRHSLTDDILAKLKVSGKKGESKKAEKGKDVKKESAEQKGGKS